MATTVGSSTAKIFSGQENDEVTLLDESLFHGWLKNSETPLNLESLCGHLSKERCAQLSALINSYLCLLKFTPSRTHLVEHDIDVGEVQPIRHCFYWVSEESTR